MAVTLHNVTFTAGAASAVARSLIHTATDGSCLLVWIYSKEDGSISAVAAGGAPLTKLGDVFGGTNAPHAELWGLTAPAAGALTISATQKGTAQALWGIAATSYVGQRTSATPFGDVTSATGAAATVTNFSISSTATSLVAFMLGQNGDTAITLNTGTLRADVTHSTGGRMVIGDIAGAPTISVSASATGSGLWVNLGINLIESAGGAPATRNGSATFTDVADTFSASGYAGPVTGTFAATDAPDTFSSTNADVIVRGTFAATDTGSSTFSAPGYVLVRGSLSAADTVDTFAASGTVRVTGTFSATDTSDTFAATGKGVIQGTFIATDAADVFTATSKVVIQGSLSATDVQDTFVGLSGLPVRSATFAATDAPDLLSAVAQAIVIGTFAATDPVDAFSATASLGALPASDAPAVVATLDTPSLGGKPERRRKSSKPPYIQANSDFWEARERYLASLQPEIVSEPEPQALPQPAPDINPAAVSPQLVAYRIERQEIISALPLATSMRQLRAAGAPLIAVNARIAEQKRLQLAALAAEQAAIQEAERRRRKLARIRVLKRKAVLLAAAEVSIALSHMQRNY